MKKSEELKALAEKAVAAKCKSDTLDFETLACTTVDYEMTFDPELVLALLADREQLREALEADVKIIGGFLDRLTPEAVFQPELSTAHLGLLEAMHCFKRAREALKKSDEVE